MLFTVKQIFQIFAHKTYAPILELVNSNDTDLPHRLSYEYFNTAPIGMPRVSFCALPIEKINYISLKKI